MTDQIVDLKRDLTFGFIDNSIEAKQIYDPRLIANSDDQSMISAIREELRSCNSFRFSIAFISSSGLAMLKQDLLNFKGTGTIITSRYLDFNEPSVFRELLNMKNIDIRIYQHPDVGFHAKGYLFEQSPILTAIIGSSNLTETALVTNQEWNLRFSTQTSGDISYQIDAAIKKQLASSIPLTEEWIVDYERSRQPRIPMAAVSFAGEVLPSDSVITPNAMQREALAALAEMRELGEKRAIIISATGTGKTILAALAAKEADPSRVLFVVHREQIAAKALTEFQRVFGLPAEDFGRFTAGVREIDKKFVFATAQTLSKSETLATIPKNHFDFIIIDESHHSAAKTFRNIIDHFEPAFLLGLTATPERTDTFNIFELFDFNVAYEIRLQRALEEKMLVPFHYFGVADYTDAHGNSITETSNLSKLVSKERVKFLLGKLEEYGLPQDVKGLMFCSRKEEAKELSELLNKQKVFGKPLRTVALTGEDDRQTRELQVKRLENGELDYIITVDIFNEGIDIPSINQVVLLRSTQSSIIFTQQLGRGLRKYEGKDHLRVIDFIGNYNNNFLIPLALFGDNSRNKDVTRKYLIDRKAKGVISGVSSVNFDPIAEARILDSLAKAKLNGIEQFKKDILNLQNRLNKVPRLIDFARFDLIDPVVLATTYKTYWSLLSRAKFVDTAPTDEQYRFLYFLTHELLNGKRPHELLMLRELLQRGSYNFDEATQLLARSDTNSEGSTVESALGLLTYDFLNGQQTTPSRCGDIPIVEKVGQNYQLNSKFSSLYHSPQNMEFRDHVNDIIETGLFLARENNTWSGGLRLYGRYSRKDVCRLLKWHSNQEGSIYGYKADSATSTCPIFVTYHKGDEFNPSVNYEDRFLNQGTLRWFSKSNRTLKSNDVKNIVNGSVELHIFVKKDNAEGTDFFYLGTAQPTNPVEQRMTGNDGESLPVVSIDLQLSDEVNHDLYEYLQAPSPTP
ncbi:DEAD/DEAH box helicase [Staphylococcus chromogenes]|nr:DEAD/DEAH box helicase [Staphylococcus chromogenes]